MKNCSFPKWPGFGRARLVLGLSFQTEKVKLWCPESVPLAQRMLESSCVLDLQVCTCARGPNPTPTYTLHGHLAPEGMATLGYRDSGSVVLSKAEALRQAHEKADGLWKFWIQGLPKGLLGFKRTGTLDWQGLALAKQACNWQTDPTSRIEMDERCLQIA